MARFPALLLFPTLLSSLAFAQTEVTLPRESRPARGFVLRLEPGFTVWNLDAARLESQVGAEAPAVRPLLVDQTRNGFGLLLHLGYNFAGHATVGVDVTGTSWDLFSNDRGGGGFIGGTVAWHPLALLDALEVLQHPLWRSFDLSVLFGAGYGVFGEMRALDGLHYVLGARAEYFFNRHFSVGLAVRYLLLSFSRYILSWSDDNSVPLPNGSGGSMLFPSLTFSVHAG